MRFETLRRLWEVHIHRRGILLELDLTAGSKGSHLDQLFELTGHLIVAASRLDKYSSEYGIRGLTFDGPAPDIALNATTRPYYDSRSTVIEAAEQIIRLVRGPRDVLLALSFEHCAQASLQLVLKYKFANHIPLDGFTTYGKISQAVGQGVTPSLVERTVQHAASFCLFETKPGGYVRHNAVSALLVQDPDLEAWMYLSSTIAYPAGAAIPNAIEKYGVSMEADEAGYGVSIGRKIAQFQRFREPDGKKDHEMFARAMRGISAGGNYDFRHAVTGYPWHLLSEGAGHLVVDVGGGPGHVAIALAQGNPTLRFEVQDLPETVQVGAQNCPSGVKERVSFSAHDFFTPQPRHEVREDEGIAYFARFILHDWSDKYATKIVQQLATGLRPQDRIILNEVVVPETGQEPRELERRMHDRDLLMLMNLNGRERTQSAFEQIFASVEPPLRLKKVYRPAQGELSLIEVVLDGVGEDLRDGAVDGINGDWNEMNGNHSNGVNGHGVNGFANGMNGHEANGHTDIRSSVHVH
ncbi:O-methyltransferase ctb2 [Vermiconidia calcicola]|uniref:O-methyltransferase ctb2 n=1 Tax=Vermiconidia calcicola TaxID=1690605 RepID=A0ACC3NBG2_9PEZI|nr:O-methyltransferase ctb2 [Vermiconidia calcicola]